MATSALQGRLPQGLGVVTHVEFWRRYLAAHSDPRTRGLHYLGTSLAVAAIAAAAIERDWRWLAAAPIAGYGLAWLGRGKFGHNRPGRARNDGAYCLASLGAAAKKRGMPPKIRGELLAIVGMATEANSLANGYRVPVEERFAKLF